jgi:ABC-2 type transport system permease protein
MKPFPALVRAGLKANFGLSVLRYRFFREKKDRWLLPLFALAGVSLVPTLTGALKLIHGLYGMLSPLSQQAAILTFGVLAGQFLVLLFGLYYVISAFYFSRDLEILIPLPLQPFQVIVSKFIVICVNEYVTIFLIVVPIFVQYGILSHAGAGYWAAAVVVYLLLPVIPLAIVSLLVIGLMRIVNVSRKKDALILVGSLVMIAGSMLLQSAFNRAGHSGMSGESLAAFFSSPDSLLSRLGSSFPPSVWATKAMVGGGGATGPAHLALFVGVSLLFFLGIVALSEKLFYRGLIGLGEITARRRRLSSAEMSRRVTSGRRPFRAILAREWRIMNRTPIFLLNGVLVVVIIPVVLVLMFKTGREQEAFILKFLGAANPAALILGAAAFLTVSGSLNGTSSSTFSREGGQFWISKVIPVAPRDQVLAKLVHSYSISVLGVAVSAVAASVMFRLRIGILAPAVLLALTAGLLLTIVGMLIDLARPLLDWTNPQKAIKQNLNVLFATLAGLGLLAGSGWLGVALMRRGMEGRTLVALLLGLFAFLSAAGLVALFRFAERRYRDIEV